MHARLTVHSNQHADIDFDRELPIFPEPNPPATRFTHFLFHRGQSNYRTGSLRHFAVAMWRGNHGFWSVEVDDPRRYVEFGRDLLLIEGLNGITTASRFTIGITVGRCFDAAEVATAVAGIVHKHFYRDEALTVSHNGNPVAEVVPTAHLAPPTRHPLTTDPGGGRQPATRRVAVYQAVEPNDREFGESLAARFELVSIVEVESDGLDDPREICAEAWIQCLGRSRQEFLSEALHAPAEIVERQCDRGTIVGDLSDIPSGFGPIQGFLYDNMVETWLLELPWDQFPTEPTSDERAVWDDPRRN